MFLTKDIFVNLAVSFLICLGLTFEVFSQHGNPYLVNYSPEVKNIDNQNFAIVQGADGLIYFANRNGVLTYDGFEWDLIRTESAVFSLTLDKSDGQIYVGCRGSFGLLQKEATGEVSYVMLSGQNKSAGLSEISKILVGKDGIYFYSDYSLFLYSLKENNINNTWHAQSQQVFTGLFELENTFYLNIQGNGLHRITESGLEPIENGAIFSSTEILTAIQYDADNVLLGTSENEIFLFDGTDMQPFEVEAADYLLESSLAGGLDLSNKHFVLSTLTGGCIIIEKQSGKTVHTLNYQTGLPDDEIYAMGTDRNGGLWLAHDYGISRADISVPVRNYSSYPGIEGNLISVIDHDSTVYVATTEGVYYLTEVNDLSEVLIYIKEPKKRSQPKQFNIESIYVKPYLAEEPDSAEIPKEDIPATIDADENKKPEGFKLFGYRVIKEKKRKSGNRRKNKSNDLEKAKKSAADEGETKINEDKDTLSEKSHSPAVTTQQSNISRFYLNSQDARRRAMDNDDPTAVKKVYAMQSIKHVFKLVNGLKEKCKQMVEYNELLLVATNTGLYEIKNREAIPIIKDRYINHVSQSSADENRFFVATSTGIFSVYHTENSSGRSAAHNWKVEDPFNDIRGNVYSVVEDESYNLWLGCDNSVYHVTMGASSIPLKYERIQFESSTDEPVLARSLYGTPFFFMSSGILRYDGQKDSIEYREDINELYPPNCRFMYSQEGITWINDGVEWRRFNAAQNTKILKDIYLGLFDNVQSIYIDAENNYWIINNKNELFKIIEDKQEKEYVFDLDLQTITNNNDLYFSLADDLTVNYDRSSLEFRMSAPFYLKEGAVLYQYMVDGLMKDWTQWSADPLITFPFIPAGNYSISMRAKNILGGRTTVKTFQFSVSPPFWQTWWFYLLCTLIGVGGVIALVKLRTRSVEKEKKILEIKVKERTEELAKKNKDITDSIKYAQRIQEAVMPVKASLVEILPSSFILYKPKDIVSGDFYWFTKKKDVVIVAAVDCTGHGVPGAFMSLIGSNLLNEIVEVHGIIKPIDIIKALHKGVVDTLKKDKKDSTTVDGMDLALCTIDLKKKTLEYAGAGCPLIIINKGGKELIKANRNPIGLVFDRSGKPSIYEGKAKLLSHKTKLQKGDTFYMFTDGYCDQFGGEDNSKFMRGRFMDLLADIQNEGMSEQEALLNDNIEKWKGVNQQLDDMLVIGIRI